MRVFVTSLTEGNPDEESVVKTSREIIRGGQLLDQMIEERREQAERCSVCVLRHHCEHQVKG
jgi:hypothetical protein